MSQFDEREKAFEQKFQQDEEQKFKVLSHAAYLFGLWAAKELGLRGAEATSYADKNLELVLAKDGKTSLLDKVERDMKSKKLPFPRQRLVMEFDALHHKAEDQLRSL